MSNDVLPKSSRRGSWNKLRKSHRSRDPIRRAVLHLRGLRGQGVPELVVSEIDTERLIRLQPPVERAATAVTAFIGRAVKGPVDRAITITSFDDYQRVFGGLWQPSTLSYAVEQFFENG